MHPRSIWHKTALVLVLFALSAGLPALATTHTVNVQNFQFVPANITVAPGDTIHWVWVIGSHTVTSGSSCTYDGLYFDHPINNFGNTTFDFVVPSGVPSIPYFCRIHCISNMVGLITVQSPNVVNFQITMDGAQETPPNNSAATGSGTATLDVGTNLFSWNITFSGLSSNQTAAHFHGPALPCATASPQIPLPLGSPIVGSKALTSQQAADVLAGRWYVNVHTSNFPGGEIRGQVYPAPLTDPIPATIPQGSLRVRLVSAATGLTAPNWATSPPGQPGRLIVTDQNGTLWSIDPATGTKTVFLDVTSRLVPLGIFGPNSFDERGLLGVAFHPNYVGNGLLYTFTSEPVNGPADFTTLPQGAVPNCQSVLAEWHVASPGDPNSVVDPNSRREIVRIDKPQFNHNGGGLVFGPDGKLYISLGDGGGADDKDGQMFLGEPIVGHGCSGNGQNTNAILGKLLRIDPLGNNSGNGKYGIPSDNPFFNGGGLKEIWAYGLRNPWRYSFDSQTGQLICADVGQNDIEEIDFITAGGNYGWNRKEGTFYFVFNGNQAGYVTDIPLDLGGATVIDPIGEYDHDEGLAIIGGFVYRGAQFPQLVGKYVFGDFARTFNNDGRLFYLDTGNQIKEFKLAGLPALGKSLLGFGEDGSGEIYVLANGTGTPFGTTGVVLRIASDVGDMNCDGVVDFGDIDPFVLALIDPAAYQTQYPNCDYLNGDVNDDGQVNFGDIDPFVALLTGP